MKEIIQIIKQLRNTSSTKEKENILKNNKDNELLKKVLYYTYNDTLKYGISEKSIEPNSSKPLAFFDIFELLDVLEKNNINDNLRFEVNNFLGNFKHNEDLFDLYKCIILRDLRCNISNKTIEKVFKGLLPKWDVQQAYPIDKVKLKKNEWIALSLKLNGVRSTFINDVFKSRQNKVMEGLDHIKDDLRTIVPNLDNFVVDGEMIRRNVDMISDNENFRLTTSILNSDDNDKSLIQFVVFDVVPKQEFLNGQSEKGFKERLELLKTLQKCIEVAGTKNISIAPTYYTGNDHSKIEELLDKVDSEGYEGIMLLRDMPYKTKRHNGILKCKKFKTADCRIVGYEEGTGRLKNTLGSFVIDYKGNRVNVGSGYTDFERKEFWKQRDKYIGRVLEVKFKEESMDSKTGLISLQFPTFVGIREIGKEISYN